MTPAKIALLAAGLALLLVTTGSAAADEDLVLVDSFGVWTLEKLGYGDLTLPVDGETAEVSIRYALAPGAAQGPDGWYLIRLHLNIEVADNSGQGSAIVSALTNDRASAQIRFDVDGEGESFSMTWDSVDLLNGYIEEATASHDVEVRFSNYLPFAGVGPGQNVLTFKLEQFRDIRISSIRVLDDSGIEYTPLSPPKLELNPTLPDNRVKLGDVFEIGYELKNVGDRPANDVAVGVIYPREGFTLIGDTPHSFPSITGSVAGAFTMQAIGEGTFEIVLGAESPSSRPVAQIQATVYASDWSFLFLTRGRLAAAVPLAFLFALVIAAVVRRIAVGSRARERE